MPLHIAIQFKTSLYCPIFSHILQALYEVLELGGSASSAVDKEHAHVRVFDGVVDEP